MKFGKSGKNKKKKIQSGTNNDFDDNVTKRKDINKVESVDFINEQNELENTLLDGNDEQSLPKGMKNSKGIGELVKQPKMHAKSNIPLNSTKLLNLKD